MSTPVHAVATPWTRAVWVALVVMSVSRATSRHDFLCAKIHGLDVVLCRDVMRQVEFGFYIVCYVMLCCRVTVDSVAWLLFVNSVMRIFRMLFLLCQKTVDNSCLQLRTISDNAACNPVSFTTCLTRLDFLLWCGPSEAVSGWGGGRGSQAPSFQPAPTTLCGNICIAPSWMLTLSDKKLVHRANVNVKICAVMLTCDHGC